ncbi:MAG: phosphatidate cytidylyltransferase [Phycisphaeraceae bacterium]|nr:MAG: phosphatidate cytidylyltransferase [Phycisphaeraceae bacterium]
MLRYRLLLGPVLIAALVLVLWAEERLTAAGWPRGAVLLAVMALVGALAARELARILREKNIGASTGLTIASAMLGLAACGWAPGRVRGDLLAALVGSAAVIVLLASVGYYSRRRNPQGAIASAGGALLAFVYLGLMFGFVAAIRREHSAWLVLYVLLVVKASDTGAYFAGRAFGRRKLIAWLSPGKTWEGLVGGILLASLAGWLGLAAMREWLPGERLPPAWSGALAGALGAVVGQMGDLVMSLFKRDAGRKDSGHSLPGFGGVLDVLDSPLLVAPLAYWWLVLAS